MPASRRARATTLAPRSWPSRPGLAMITLILRSSAMRLIHHLREVAHVHHQVLPDRTCDYIGQRSLRAPRRPEVPSQQISGRVLYALDVPLAVAADLLHDLRDRLFLLRRRAPRPPRPARPSPTAAAR